MPRRTIAISIVVVALLAGALALYVLVYAPLAAHTQWSDRMRANLEVLRAKRPPDVSPDDWDDAVARTINLHANVGGIPGSVDLEEAGAFADELERRLLRDVTFATVDWVWDEYVRFSKIGQSYSDRWRPVRPDRPKGTTKNHPPD